jgi:uncharacterized protein YodC (DUF2158 family)
MKAGDVVQLVSGSFPMTVKKVSNGNVTCCWSHQNDIREAVFPEAILIPISLVTNPTQISVVQAMTPPE